MRKSEQGFSAIEILIVVVVIGVIGSIGYGVVHRLHNVASISSGAKTNSQVAAIPQTTATTQPIAEVGTTQGVDNVTTNDESSETAIDTKHSNSDQMSAQNNNSTANDAGEAYDESSL